MLEKGVLEKIGGLDESKIVGLKCPHAKRLKGECAQNAELINHTNVIYFLNSPGTKSSSLGKLSVWQLP